MSNKVSRINKTIKKGKASSFEKNMHIIGRCKCGAPSFCYSSNRQDTIFNVYCLSCGSISDIRFPKSGDEFLISKDQKPIDLVAEVQGVFDNSEEFYEYAKNASKSVYANDIHGELDCNESITDQISRAAARMKGE